MSNDAEATMSDPYKMFTFGLLDVAEIRMYRLASLDIYQIQSFLRFLE